MYVVYDQGVVVQVTMAHRRMPLSVVMGGPTTQSRIRADSYWCQHSHAPLY